MPASGASYIKVTNNGTVSAVITSISISYVEMMTSTGSTSNDCPVGIGATEYITLTGVGADPATAGLPYTLSVIATNGGYANLSGTFG
jgi:hypothetical protein